MNLTRHQQRLNKLLLVATLSASTLTACTDDPFGKNDIIAVNDIVFAVKDGDAHNSSSRSESQAGTYAGTYALTSVGGDTLYLSANQEFGIDVTPIAPVKSRGATDDASTLEGFGVYALRDNGSEYMRNVEVCPDDDDFWAPVEEYSWPGSGSLTFYSYAPYVESAAAEEGITRLPYFDPDTEAYLMEYVVPSDVEDQIDLMAGKPVSASASPCSITLDHKLTAIRFATGREMAPSVIRSITISGVKYRGVLNLDEGKWTLDDETTSFTIVCDKELEKGTDEFVADNTPITGTDDDNLTLLLMPQDLGKDAKISLTLDWNDGVETKQCSFESSLAGKTWRAGTTLTYRLSANPGIPVLKLEVIDGDTGKPLTEITPGWKGGKKNYQVISIYDPADGTDAYPIPWTAELIDKDGKVLTEADLKTDQYNWIDYFQSTGSGGTQDCRLITVLPEVTILKASPETQALRMAQNINDSTQYNPFNLASLDIYYNNDGTHHNSADNMTYNTANCYLVNASGTYSLPLVYGNAIEEGKNNTDAYVYNFIGRNLLPNFINHLGNKIENPYIYANTGCVPYEAKLVWADQINLVHNVHLDQAKQNIIFDVPHKSIRQGNVMLAVLDENGNALWSWHIWITPMTTNSVSDYIPINHTDATHGLHQHYLFHTNIGHVYQGDEVRFGSEAITIRYTQHLPDELADELTAHTIDVLLAPESKTTTTPEYFLLYQWGRKDPVVPDIQEYYDESHNVISSNNLPKINLEKFTAHKDVIAESIRKPTSYLASDKLIFNFEPYGNLWNIEKAIDEFGNSRSGKPRKSVYDPCPVGCKLPVGGVLELFKSNATKYISYEWDYSVSPGAGIFTIENTADDKTSTSERMFIFAMGNRDSKGFFNLQENSKKYWTIWEGTQPLALHGYEDKVISFNIAFTTACGVRPMHEEKFIH